MSEPCAWAIGYGDWIGPGSATLIGAGTTARDTVATITGTVSGRPGGARRRTELR